MEYIRILTCKAMTTDEIWVRILIYNDCGTEKFLNVYFPVSVLLSSVNKTDNKTTTGDFIYRTIIVGNKNGQILLHFALL